MTAQEHIGIVQEQLRLLSDEGHLTGKPSVWHYHLQASQYIESLRVALLQEQKQKGKYDE